MRWVKWGMVALLGGMLVIQLVPYGRHMTARRWWLLWDSAQTRELTVRACFDCHKTVPQR